MHKSTNAALLEFSQTPPREAVAETGSFHVASGGLTPLCLSVGLVKALAGPRSRPRVELAPAGALSSGGWPWASGDGAGQTPLAIFTGIF